MVFEKNSTRTRVSFDMAIRQLGGTSLILDGATSQLGRGEVMDPSDVEAEFSAQEQAGSPAAAGDAVADVAAVASPSGIFILHVLIDPLLKADMAAFIDKAAMNSG